jgi:AraC-like DNA-binding protein
LPTGHQPTIELARLPNTEVAFQMPGDQFLICILLTGRLQGSADQRPIANRINGIAFWLAANQRIKFKACSNTTTLLLTIPHQHLPPNDLPHYLSWKLNRHEKLLLACSKEVLRQQDDHDALKGKNQNRESMQSLTSQLIAKIISDCHEEITQTYNSLTVDLEIDDNAILEEFEALTELHMGQNIKISDFCERLHITQRRLQQITRAQLNKTPRQVLKERKLIELRSLLAKGNSLKDSCHRVGLKRSSQLAKEYQKLFGEKPSITYRNALLALQAITRASHPNAFPTDEQPTASG